MEKKLLMVINKTDQQFRFVNKECDNDDKGIQPYISTNLASLNLTPGQHGEGCDIPDCSAEKYFADHHMGFIIQENNTARYAFSFWYDDDQHQYYYTKSGTYADAKVIPGNVSNSAAKKAIYIMNDDTLQISDIY